MKMLREQCLGLRGLMLCDGLKRKRKKKIIVCCLSFTQRNHLSADTNFITVCAEEIELFVVLLWVTCLMLCMTELMLCITDLVLHI